MPSTIPADRLAALLKRRQVADLATLARAVPGRSRRSVFRDLASLGYLVSYTHAGRYYALRAQLPFDADGLWCHRDIGFSRHGTLKRTAAQLVESAAAGRTHEELEARLRVRMHNTLLDLVEHEGLGRERVGGVYLYVGSDPVRALAQLEERRRLLAASTVVSLPLGTVVEVLVEALRSLVARASPVTLAGRLAARGVTVTVAQVEQVLRDHGVGEKKVRRSRSARSPP